MLMRLALCPFYSILGECNCVPIEMYSTDSAGTSWCREIEITSTASELFVLERVPESFVATRVGPVMPGQIFGDCYRPYGLVYRYVM